MKTTAQRREQLERLIAGAELEAHQNPRLYNVKVVLLALLGYAVIFGILLTLITLLGGIGWAAVSSTTLILLLVKKKIIFVILATIYVLIRAVWIRFASPTGYEIIAKDFPELFKELKSLTRILCTPKIHKVIITPEYNAAILQTPRLGIFGWYKNTLFLGLELLMSMTPQQARSVIAHELGHLSGKHGRFSAWIYRVRLSWQRIMVSLEQQQHFGANLLRYFFDWYSPTFSAYSFALARANEYSADATAARITSNEDMAQALVNSYIVHELLTRHYWQPFFKHATESAQPATSPYSELRAFLKHHRFEENDLTEQLNKAMKIRTGHYDTHPALKDRLNALQCKPTPPEPVQQSAARLWFGQQLPRIIKDFDTEWLRTNLSKWQQCYHHAKTGRNKLADLNAKPLQNLSADDLWQLAVLTEEFCPDTDCLPLYEHYGKKQPHDGEADFVIGRLLLERDNEVGVERMKLAMDKQPSLKLTAYEWLIYFYRRRDDYNATKFWQQQADRQIDINHAADKEREVISANDSFIKPDRLLEINELFTNRIVNIKGVKHAWLVEKRMRYYPESKTFVLAIEKGLFDREEKITRLIGSQLDPNFTCFVVIKGGDHSDIAQQIIRLGKELF